MHYNVRRRGGSFYFRRDVAHSAYPYKISSDHKKEVQFLVFVWLKPQYYKWRQIENFRERFSKVNYPLFKTLPETVGYITSPKQVDESLFITFTKSALLIVPEVYLGKKSVGGQSSVQQLKLKNNQFCDFCAQKRSSVNCHPVDIIWCFEHAFCCSSEFYMLVFLVLSSLGRCRRQFRMQYYSC